MGSTVHAAVDATHGTAKVGLGLVASSRDGEGHLTLHGSTSLGGLDASSGEGTLGPGLKRSDLRGDLHVEDSTGALVHRLHLKDHASGTTLTGTDGIESIEASAGGSSLHGGVASVLGNLVAGDGAVEANGGTGQLLGCHATGLTSVTLELAEAGVERGTHAAEVAGGLAAVLLDDRVETLVGTETLVLTTVTNVDNATHLSVHATVDAVLGLTVTLDGAGNLIDAGDHLALLTLDNRLHVHHAGLEGGLGSTELAGGLGTGSRDVGQGLREPAALESGLSAKSSGHTLGRLVHETVSTLTVADHLAADRLELGGGGGHDTCNLVVGPRAGLLVLSGELGGELGAASSGLTADVVDLVVELLHGALKSLGGVLGVGLDLHRVGRDTTVGTADAGVQASGTAGKGTLLSEHSILKLAGGGTLAGVDGAADSTETARHHAVTPVGKLGSRLELSLGAAHSVGQGVLGTTSVHVDLLVQDHFHALALLGVDHSVASNHGVDLVDVTEATSLLGVHLLLDGLEVVEQTHLTCRGGGEDGTGLEHIHAVHARRHLG